MTPSILPASPRVSLGSSPSNRAANARRDAGVPEVEPAVLGQYEGASLLANDARERLRADGFTDSQIGR
jgi:hypothetical protein